MPAGGRPGRKRPATAARSPRTAAEGAVSGGGDAGERRLELRGSAWRRRGCRAPPRPGARVQTGTAREGVGSRGRFGGGGPRSGSREPTAVVPGTGDAGKGRHGGGGGPAVDGDASVDLHRIRGWHGRRRTRHPAAGLRAPTMTDELDAEHKDDRGLGSRRLQEEAGGGEPRPGGDGDSGMRGCAGA